MSGITYEGIPGFINSEEHIENLIPSKVSNQNQIIRESFPPHLRENIRLVKHINKGANNEIFIYDSEGLSIVFRLSQYPLFQLNTDNIISVIGDSTENKIKHLKEAIQSKSNWERASNDGYSPHLYKYGYLEIHRQFYNYIVCEKMDSDLNDYYKTGPGKDSISTGELSEADHIIAKQLIDLLYATTNSLGLICFDIKPANCMINYSNPDNIVVKLIDWDGDWCQDYSNVTTITDYKDLISILSVMVMAAHFYIYLNWNIFYTYFLEPDEYGHYVREKHNILKSLFCNDLKDPQGKKSEFDFFQKHYFKLMDKEKKPLSCEDAFDIIFTRAHFLNKGKHREFSRSGHSLGGKRKKSKKRKTKSKNKKRKSKRRSKKTSKFRKKTN